MNRSDTLPGGHRPPGSVWTGLTAQELCLAGGELLVAQHAGGVQLRQFFELGCQVRPGSRWCGRGRGRILRRRRCVLLLLSLRISYTLPIGHVLLLLRSRILLCIFLLLMVLDDAGGSDDDRGSYDGAH